MADLAVAEVLLVAADAEAKAEAGGATAPAGNCADAGDKGAGLARRWALTAAMCLGLLGLGMSLAMLGPTLLDLAHQTDSTLGQMGGVFTARSLGYLVGSMLGGELFDRVHNVCVLMAIASFSCALGGFLVPFTHKVAQLGCCVVLQGQGLGFLDTGCNVLLLRLWGRHSGPYMQLLHFCFAIGALLAPLIAQRFIAPLSKNTDSSSSADSCDTGIYADLANTTAGNASGLGLTTPAPDADPPRSSEIKYAFWIAAAVMLLVALFFAVLSWSVPKGGDKAHASGHSSKPYRKRGWYYNSIIALVFLFLMVYVGLEVAYGGYLYSFTIKYCPLQFSERTAALVTAAYWGFFSLGRFLAIPLSTRVSPLKMVLGNIICITTAMAVMLAKRESSTAVWVCTAFFGVGMASMFPCMISLTETFVDLNGRAASIILVGAALGEMLLPLIVGSLFTSLGPYSFAGTILVFCFIADAFFGIFAGVSFRGQAYHEHKLATAESPALEDVSVLRPPPATKIDPVGHRETEV